jgi:transcriptional regulator with XRE-family HTH domain
MAESFGQRFQRLRKAKGFTQEQIAERVNISYQAVSKWENDITSPDISILGELANILEVTVDELLGRVDPNKVTLVEEPQRKELKNMLLKIIVDSKNGDKVNIKLPMLIIKTFLDSGAPLKINGNKALEDIDFKQIFDLVEQGVIGELVNIESKNGDIVKIIVE